MSLTKDATESLRPFKPRRKRLPSTRTRERNAQIFDVFTATAMMAPRRRLGLIGAVVAILSGLTSIYVGITLMTETQDMMGEEVVLPLSEATGPFTLGLGVIILLTGLVMIGAPMRLMGRKGGALMLIYGIVMLILSGRAATDMAALMPMAPSMVLMIVFSVAMLAIGATMFRSKG